MIKCIRIGILGKYDCLGEWKFLGNLNFDFLIYCYGKVEREMIIFLSWV